MRYRLKTAVAALSIAVLAGCPATTGPTEELDVDFEWGINRLQTEPAFVVNPGTGEVTLRGNYETPCSGYTAVGRAQTTDNHLVLYVNGRQPDGCRQAVGSVGYQATIRAIPPGTYAVSVAHNYPVSGATNLILVGSQVVIR